MVLRTRLRILLGLLFTAVLLTSFQNCSGCAGGKNVDFSSDAKSGNSPEGIVGNGEPVDGKPSPGRYYRIIPEFKCEGKSMIAGKIIVDDNGIQAEVVDPATCDSVAVTPPPKDLEISRYNRAFIGFQTGVFEKIEVPGWSDPDPSLKNYSVTEAWCRRKGPQGGNLDVVVRQDLSTGLLTATLLSPSDTPLDMPSVRRSGTPETISYATSDFSLSIALSSSGLTAQGEASGRLQARWNGTVINDDVSCRTSARLDQLTPTSPPSFRILGVTGATDGDIDSYLTDGTNAVIHWQPTAEASSYRVTILDNASPNELCSSTFSSVNPTSQTMTGCTLARGQRYRIAVTMTSVFGQTTAAANNELSFYLGPTPCPIGYVQVPALAPYTTQDFCVAKYEAKIQGAVATSTAIGIPTVNVNRDEALTACTANGTGFDLISNDEWQTIARNIEAVVANWSGGGVGVGALNTGHSDGSVGGALAASADDTDACVGTGQSCGLHGFNSQKRTLALSNGYRIWDLAGNIWEWMRDDNFISYGADGYMAVITNNAPYTNQAKDKFGPAGTYPNLTSGAWGGLGYALINANSGGIVRGSYWDGGAMSGVFRADTTSLLTTRTDRTGFRCVFHLP